MRRITLPPGRWPLLGVALLLNGCSLEHWPVLDPVGPVGLDERNLIFLVVGIMLLVVVPVIAMTVWFAWRYRASNRAAVYAPQWSENGVLSVLFWLIPGVIVAALAAITWVSSHRLSPYKPLTAETPPLTVQVVALDWKWLFIYPEQHIASVNRLVLPAGVPVKFDITADTVMNSFFIPRLGGQVYAMAGMQTELHLRADRPGTYYGENTQYSGRGFPFQNFETRVLPGHGFDDWVKRVKQQHHPLDEPAYARLAKASVRHPVELYSSVTPHLFADVMAKYTRADYAPSATTGPVGRN